MTPDRPETRADRSAQVRRPEVSLYGGIFALTVAILRLLDGDRRISSPRWFGVAVLGALVCITIGLYRLWRLRQLANDERK